MSTSRNDFASGAAYLTRSIGPGVTSSSEIVPSREFVAPFSSDLRYGTSRTILFSNLTLDPGTYFLTLTAPFLQDGSFFGSPIVWEFAGNPGLVVDVNARLEGLFFYNSVSCPTASVAYPPAHGFCNRQNAGDPTNLPPLFSVYSVENVPEPGVIALLLLALVIAGISRSIRISRG